MFLNIMNKIFDWAELNSTDKYLRIVILGLVMYVVAYYFINSEYCNTNKFVSENKQYIYGILIFDLILYICSQLLTNNSTNKMRNKKKRRSNHNSKNDNNLLKNSPLNINSPNYLENNNNLANSNQDIENETIDIPIYKSSTDNN